MTDPPTGEVTFFFTDIQGSTAMWERDAKRMQLALARHDEVLKGVVESHGGFVFKMVGDACCAAFASTPDALQAALAAQRAIIKEPWDDRLRVSVRMALHTGRAEERDGDYFGPPLNRVARLLASGHGGQTLISRPTREQVEGRLPEEVTLRDMGERRLKDLKEPERIFQLLAPDLPSEFPPLKTLETSSNEDRYRLIRQIGSGGMAEVYLAYDEVLEREVAFKVLDRKHAENREAVERFRREARNAASLSHDPNIVSIHDRGETQDGTYYLVMEYMQGGTLEDLIEREGLLSPQRATEVALQVARALSVAHETGVIHRDIKPQNILLSKTGEAKVADFGIARAVAATTMTQAGSVMGTVHYISPEQALGENATPRSDLYSLGVVLYEMLTGELPYDAETTAGIIMQHVGGLSRSPRDAKAEVPEELDAVTARLLARDPEDRYADASALVEDLERAEEGLPLDAATTERRAYPENSSVVITGEGEPILKKMAKRAPSRTVKMLEAAIAERMPERNLTDIVCAVEHWTGWTGHLGPLSGSEPKLENARERYVITAFGYGTNMGPAQTARHTRSLVSAHELGYVNRRHVSTGKLEAATTDVVNVYSGLDLPRVWGTGETAAADGTKIDLYENNLTSEYHIRYGGYGGIAYHHVSDTYVALFTHFIACGVWEAVYIIDGLLKNASEIQPRAVASDTQGQSAPVFGLAHLLGIELMPRIRNWKGLILFCPDKDAGVPYEHIDALFSEAIDWKLIETHWKDLMRVVISIRAGKVLPSTLLRKLGNYSRKNRLYRAFREVGRVVRTEFLLRFLSDQGLRQQITAATNKAESYNAFSKWLFFGGDGMLSENDPEEQEKRMKFNELLANSLILQNAVDVTEALKSLSREGYELKREDIVQLSPYLTGHVKRFGDYVIDLDTVPEQLNGEMPALAD